MQEGENICPLIRSGCEMNLTHCVHVMSSDFDNIITRYVQTLLRQDVSLPKLFDGILTPFLLLCRQ